MSAAATVQRLFAARTRSEVLVDVGAAVATMAGTLALLAHGGFAPSHPGSGGFHPMGVVLAAGSTLPLIAWRRHPLGVFAATAAATVLLAGLGYPADPVLGPTVALYLLASSRERQHPWTWRTLIPKFRAVVDSSMGDLLSVHLEISCPSAESALSAYLEFGVSVVTVCRLPTGRTFGSW
jgi:hypothetical protein